MGLGSNDNNDDDVVVIDDVDGGGCCEGGKSYGMVSCSICLETVTDNGDRSWAKLQCGHQFHLDCIGSAINVKGVMQCPNCRKIEKGQWLYANGSRSLPEFSMEEFNHEEDMYDLNYSDMSFGVHWCPFGNLARLPSLFEDGEFSPSAYHDLFGPHAIYAEHAAVSASHPCPYIAFLGPVHPSTSNSNGTILDSSSYSNHWGGVSAGPGEIPTSYAFPAMDVHYQNWEQHLSPFSTSNGRIGGVDQHSIPPVAQRSGRTSSDTPRSGSFVHPFLAGHSSGSRAGTSVASSMIPPYPGSNARARDRVQALQAYYQQQPSSSPAIRTAGISSTRRSNRGLAQVGPTASSSDQGGGLYFIPSSASSHNFQDAEYPVPPLSHVPSWERDHIPPFPLNQTDGDLGWGPFHQGGGGGGGGASDPPGIRPSVFRQRHHGSGRTSTQNWS